MFFCPPSSSNADTVIEFNQPMGQLTRPNNFFVNTMSSGIHDFPSDSIYTGEKQCLMKSKKINQSKYNKIKKKSNYYDISSYYFHLFLRSKLIMKIFNYVILFYHIINYNYEIYQINATSYLIINTYHRPLSSPVYIASGPMPNRRRRSCARISCRPSTMSTDLFFSCWQVLKTSKISDK